MGKYRLTFVNSLSEFFAYRLNFILWRLRAVVTILITYFLWQSVFQGRTEVFGYSPSHMFTYILMITILQGIVLSTQTHKVAAEINMGDLSNFLIKPVNFFGFNLARDLADKVVNTVFSFFEITFLYYMLRPPIVIQTSPIWLVLFGTVVILSTFLYFQINMILSFVGFWSKETWATRFIFYILVVFLAGTYFPLDIFPQPIYSFLQFLPFTYIIFFPLKIYLGAVDHFSLVKGFTIIFAWIMILFLMLKFLWSKGLKIYTSEGR